MYWRMFDLKSEFVITKDNADFASKSANSFQRILTWLGSQQNTISFEAVGNNIF